MSIVHRLYCKYCGNYFESKEEKKFCEDCVSYTGLKNIMDPLSARSVRIKTKVIIRKRITIGMYSPKHSKPVCLYCGAETPNLSGSNTLYRKYCCDEHRNQHRLEKARASKFNRMPATKSG